MTAAPLFSIIAQTRCGRWEEKRVVAGLDSAAEWACVYVTSDDRQGSAYVAAKVISVATGKPVGRADGGGRSSSYTPLLASRGVPLFGVVAYGILTVL